MSFNILFQKQNKDVARKLGLATALMFSFPILTFYVCLYFVFHEHEDPTSWSGIMAVLAANIVVFGYVYSAFSEPHDDPLESSDNDDPTKKKGPRVGFYKERTD
mmetsp:Transcript_3792/g.3564  ORF Transcript_3792/g.3564 Transcript_3792/m.3564 type:complete len:104 (-) Transcript_3792:150-461(-)